MTIEPRIESLQVPEAEFISFLKLSFGQKRKTLWNNLKTQYGEKILKEALARSGVKPTVRAEALPLAKSAALYRALREGSR
jgi:16S rRNA A1518/A1519 N6-dimethyltransferase RsmA/KsgA/DIM1 with predicted DNA glycosylase/AP lyase activity